LQDYSSIVDKRTRLLSWTQKASCQFCTTYYLLGLTETEAGARDTYADMVQPNDWEILWEY